MSISSQPSWTSAEVIRGLQAARSSLDRIEPLGQRIADAARLLSNVLLGGGRVFTAGNGGSACSAMHMAEELAGRFKANRRSLPGIALNSDGASMTCIANDFGFEHVFSRAVEGLGNPGDLLVLFTTSGKSLNLVCALKAAKSIGMKTLALLGGNGGELAGMSDVELIVPLNETAHVQEAHLIILHLLLEAVEAAFPAQ